MALLPSIRQALLLTWHAAPRWTLLWAALLIVQGILPLATVLLTRNLVNSLTLTVQSDPAALHRTLGLVAAMAALVLLGEGLRAFSGYVRTAQAELVRDHIATIIQEKSIAADLAFYESSEFYDHLHRARAEATHRPVQLLESAGALLQNGLTLAAMAAILVSYAWWLPLLLIVTTLPALAVVLQAAMRQHRWHRESTPTERRSWYYDWLLTSGETAAEVRLFHLGPYLRKAYDSLRGRLRRDRLQLSKSQSWSDLGASAVVLVLSGAAVAWVVLRSAGGRATLGDLALFYQALNQGLNLARTLLDNVGRIYQNSLFLTNLFEFLSLEPRVVTPPQPAVFPSPPRGSVEFRDVTFRYPGSQKAALENFNLSIPAGSVTAIAGPNGAGKTSLIKLLCRFYDPDAGMVLVDGTDLRSYSVEELRAAITVLFQQPVRYNATAAENIALGDLAASREEIERVARTAAADSIIRQLPAGYDQLLGKWFADGAELSVGEWQRIALARAFLRQAPLILLDEPTSAMDPWAEADWLQRFRELARGRTAILITHRFTTARLADTIHIMTEGRIRESGTHEELVSRNGYYADWWKAQRTP